MEDAQGLEGLPRSFRDRRPKRLIFVVGKYRDELEYDFAAHLPGENFGQLWRRRRWRKLMGLIDRLPRNSYYHLAIANDEEHAQMLADAGLLDKKEGSGEEWAPAMQTYTAEAELLVLVINELKSLRHVMVALKSQSPPAEPKWVKGPRTAIDRISATHYRERRQASHQKLVARMLPHKADRIG